MTDSGTTCASNTPIEATLADELARGDLVLGTAGPMLGMLLANRDSSLFSDEVVANVRGMGIHVARQILTAQADAAGIEEPLEFAADRGDALAEALARDLQFLGHCHALALEHRLAMQLERRNGIDPVLSPLLQLLVASADAETARLAMALLAAQARFVQQQRRAELPIGELPPPLFEHALSIWREHANGTDESAIEQANTRLGDAYDPQASRLSLLQRATDAAGNGMKPALSIGGAGTALFLSALGLATGQDRDIAAMAINESQVGRLALSLRAAGLEPEQVAEQFVLIHPGIALPGALDTLDPDRAAAILAASECPALV